MTPYLYLIYRCKFKSFYCGHVGGHKKLCRALWSIRFNTWFIICRLPLFPYITQFLLVSVKFGIAWLKYSFVLRSCYYFCRPKQLQNTFFIFSDLILSVGKNINLTKLLISKATGLKFMPLVLKIRGRIVFVLSIAYILSHTFFLFNLNKKNLRLW